MVVRYLSNQFSHLLNVLAIGRFDRISQSPVALRARGVEANHLAKQVCRLVDVTVEDEGVGQIHHVAGFAGCPLVNLGKESLGSLVFA